MKNIRVFLSDFFQFLEVKLSIYLNRRVFVCSASLFKVSGRYWESEVTRFQTCHRVVQTETYVNNNYKERHAKYSGYLEIVSDRKQTSWR